MVIIVKDKTHKMVLWITVSISKALCLMTVYATKDEWIKLGINPNGYKDMGHILATKSKEAVIPIIRPTNIIKI